MNKTGSIELCGHTIARGFHYATTLEMINAYLPMNMLPLPRFKPTEALVYEGQAKKSLVVFKKPEKKLG